ncbi:PDGLE domain-containing protein [bacterium]|nr:PDGLE domain-containing protein [bacterium]MBU1653020.1 PDGLE domain-containing protein [bacterium]
MKQVLPFLIVALIMAGLFSPLASFFPDGLEWAAERLGFIDHANPEPLLTSPLPDYTIPRVGDSPLSTALAGIIGTLICFFLPFTLHLLRKK